MAPWTYDRAFSRNRGLITPDEQAKLRSSRVAIAGMGGVGGIHVATLARLGVGKFTIADPDTYETANFNRQYGALTPNIGRSKAETMAEIIRQINPEAEVRMLKEPVTSANMESFMEGADLFVDGIDAYVIEARRAAFREARRRGLYGITAGPFGIGSAWLVFDPKGMSFDEYFDFSDSMNESEKVSAFMVGMVPRALHLPYQDTTSFNMESKAGPSTPMGCAIASGVMGAEALKILVGRFADIKAAPCYAQFDAYRGKLVRCRLRGGNRHPYQRFKRALFTNFITQRQGGTIVPPKSIGDRVMRRLTSILMKEKKKA